MRAAAVIIVVVSAALSAPPATAAPGPEPPRDVYAEAQRPDQVRLTWRPGVDPPPGSTPAFERYQVLRDGVLIDDTIERGLVDPWLAESSRHSYVVRAVDAQGRTADSNPVEITTPAFVAGLELSPYLQQLSPTRAVIVWQTFAPATTSLHFGPVGGPERVLERDSTLRRDHVVVVEDLTPGTAYQYRWESDGRLGEPAQLITPGMSPAEFSFGVIGDFGTPSPAARANLRRLASDRIDFAITTGDNAQIFGNEEEYRNYVLEPLRELIAGRSLWPSVGNHDYYGLANYRRYFALPGNERYYSFSYGGVLFVALDSNRMGATQRSWARALLGSSSARCKIAYFHHPLWSSGRGYRSGRRKHRRHRIVPILQRGGVDLVLNGHIQNYERSKPLRSGRRNRRGIVYVVTGGGGARLTPFATRRKPRWSARRGLFHHRLRITAGRHRLRAKAIDTAGRTRDRFAVPCRPG